MKGRLEIKIKNHFSALHQLRINGEVENPHAHNWALEVHFSVQKTDDPSLKRSLEALVRGEISALEGRNLAGIEAFSTVPPSAENLAFTLYGRLRGGLGAMPVRILRVTVEETPRCRASYIPA